MSDASIVGQLRSQVLLLERGRVLTVFAGPLERIAYEGGAPAEHDAAETFGAVDGAPCAHVGGVDLWVDLSPAFDLLVVRCERAAF